MRGADRPHPDDRDQAALRLLELQAEGQAALDSLQDAVMEIWRSQSTILSTYSVPELQTTEVQTPGNCQHCDPYRIDMSTKDTAINCRCYVLLVFIIYLFI